MQISNLIGPDSVVAMHAGFAYRGCLHPQQFCYSNSEYNSSFLYLAMHI